MPKGQYPRTEAHKASLRTSARARNQSGANNPNWKGGIVVGVDGRILVYCPGDPEAKLLGGTHALRYRLIAREKLGRPLEANEVVHHINGDPTDDRPENLQVLTQGEHARGHLLERKDAATGRVLRRGEASSPAPDLRKTCVVCGNTFIANRRHRVRQLTCKSAACLVARRTAKRAA